MLKKLLLGAAMAGIFTAPLYAQTAPAPLPAVKPATAYKASVLIADIGYIIEASDAGKFRAAELTKIGQSMDKELEPQRKIVEDEKNKLTALETGLNNLAKTIGAAGGVAEQNPDFLKKLGEYQAQKTAFQKKAQDFATNVQFAKRDLAATEEASTREILKALNPIVKTVVTAHGADILLADNANTIAYYTPNVDVTDELIAALNKAAKTVPVTRIKVPREAPQPQGGTTGGTGGLPKKPPTPGQ